MIKCILIECNGCCNFHPHILQKLLDVKHSALLTATYLLKFPTFCFKTRWAVTADIFLLSPRKTQSTRHRHQISETRLRLSSVTSTPLMGRACAPNSHCTTNSHRPSSQTPALSVITLRLTFVQKTSRGAWRDVSPATTQVTQTRQRLDYSIRSASPGKLSLSTSIKNHPELPCIISAFHRQRAVSWQISKE